MPMSSSSMLSANDFSLRCAERVAESQKRIARMEAAEQSGGYAIINSMQLIKQSAQLLLDRKRIEAWFFPPR
jgi:hypothetical protein